MPPCFHTAGTARVLPLALALALAGAATSARSQAASGVQLYGLLDAGLYSRQLAGESRVQAADSGLMTTSRWGVRGSEPLDGGWRALFDLSSQLRLDNGEFGRNPGDTAAGRFWSRQAVVGLAGPWGQFTLGRIITAGFIQSFTFNPFGASTVLNPFVIQTYVGAQPLLAARSGSDGSWNNSVQWISPAWQGWSGVVQFAPGEGTPAGRRAEAALQWRGDGIRASLVVERISRGSYPLARARTEPAGAPYLLREERSVQAALSYALGAAELFGQFADAQLQPAGVAAIDLRTASTGLRWRHGSGSWLASWSRSQREQSAAADRRRDTASVGYDHHLSKRTDVYAVLMHDRVTGLSRGNGVALGVRHNF